MSANITGGPQQVNLQKRLTAFNRVIVQLMKVTSLDQLCQEAVSMGIEKLGFDRLSIYFMNPNDPRTITGTYGTDPTGQLCVEYGITLHLSENDWLTSPAFLSAHHSGRAATKALYQPEPDNRSRIVGTGWNAAAGLWDGEKLIGYLFADNLLHQHPYIEAEGELLATYGLALGHLSRYCAAEWWAHNGPQHAAGRDHIPDLFALCSRSTQHNGKSNHTWQSTWPRAYPPR